VEANGGVGIDSQKSRSSDLQATPSPVVLTAYGMPRSWKLPPLFNPNNAHPGKAFGIDVVP
jgi:hypothetical protein